MPSLASSTVLRAAWLGVPRTSQRRAVLSAEVLARVRSSKGDHATSSTLAVCALMSTASLPLAAGDAGCGASRCVCQMRTVPSVEPVASLSPLLLQARQCT